MKIKGKNGERQLKTSFSVNYQCQQQGTYYDYKQR